MTDLSHPFTDRPADRATRAMPNARGAFRKTPQPNRVTRVGDAMSWPAVTISPVLPPYRAEALAHDRGIHHLVVCDGEHMVGVLCVCDLFSACDDDLVWDCMSTPAITLSPTASIEDAVETMLSRAVGCLPIVRRGQVYGVLTRGDLSRLGALNLEAQGQRCVSCLSHHHVRPLYGIDDTPFCLDCLERMYPTEFRQFYEEYGGGD